MYSLIKDAVEDIYYEYLEDKTAWVAKKLIKQIDMAYNGVGFAIEKKNELQCYLSDNDFVYLNMIRSIQPTYNYCGVSAAHSILKYYEINLNYDELHDTLHIEKNGCASETALYKLFRKNGLSVSKRYKAGIKTIKEAIDEYEAPILTTVNNENHWIVIYGYSKKNILILDSLPNRFSVSVSKEDFMKAKAWDKWGAIIYKK